MLQHADMLVSDGGRLACPPLLAAMTRQLAPHACTLPRRHAGVDLVCIMIAGTVRHEPVGGAPCVLESEDVMVLSTGAGIEYRWCSVGDEPAQALVFWLLSPAKHAPDLTHRHAPRRERLGRLIPIAEPRTRLPTRARATLQIAVLAAGGSLIHDTDQRCYLRTTVGAVVVDGVVVDPVDGMLAAPGTRRITALESTEIVIVDVW